MDLFVGRLHPLLVHLPIGILILAFLFEILSRFKAYKTLKVAVRPALFWGAGSAIAAGVSGYWLSQEGGYDDRLLRFHQYLGIGTAVMALLLYLHRKYSIIPDKQSRGRVRLWLFVALMALLFATGHFGGSLTHGDNFLFSAASVDSVAVILQVADPEHAKVYDEIVQPILERKCVGCHSTKKQKGQLQLEGQKGIERGGKHGAVLVAGHPEVSELYKRIVLSVETEHHMPPRERPQLSSLETNVIRSWIEEGASFDKGLNEFQDKRAIVLFIKFNSKKQASTTRQITKIEPADPSVLDQLRKQGVQVVPWSVASNYLVVSFATKKSITHEEAVLLNAISSHIIELDFSGCTIAPDVVRDMGTLPELRKLELQRSTVTDRDMQQIIGWRKLELLNLTATQISDNGIQGLKNLAALLKLYVYQTHCTALGCESLQKELPSIQIDSGHYELPFLVSDTVLYRRHK